MTKFIFALVRNSKTIHKFPAYEQCNLDDATKISKRTASLDVEGLVNQGWHKCDYCFGELRAERSTTAS